MHTVKIIKSKSNALSTPKALIIVSIAYTGVIPLKNQRQINSFIGH
jgi:hypothetical protein